MNKRKRKKIQSTTILIIILILIALIGIVIKTGLVDVLIPIEIVKTESNALPTVETARPSPPSEDLIPTESISNIQDVTVSNSTNTETITTDILEETTEESTVQTTEEPNSEENSTPIEELPIATPEPHGGTIYLTFDDGPSAEITPYILDILSDKGVPATFFIIGYKPDTVREDLVRRIHTEGHSIGLHTYSHNYPDIYSSLDDLENSFLILQEQVYNSVGVRPTIIRFPGGSSNTISKRYCEGIMTEASSYFPSQGFTIFDWNVDSGDAGGAKTAEEVFENVTTGLVPGRRNIILMHDSSSKEHTLEALEAIIDYGIENGYEFKAITSETASMSHKIAN